NHPLYQTIQDFYVKVVSNFIFWISEGTTLEY
ncbi:MAG: hypothetical protein FD133_1948, partial [Erysipelotrichaceae bacterium]